MTTLIESVREVKTPTLPPDEDDWADYRRGGLADQIEARVGYRRWRALGGGGNDLAGVLAGYEDNPGDPQ